MCENKGVVEPDQLTESPKPEESGKLMTLGTPKTSGDPIESDGPMEPFATEAEAFASFAAMIEEDNKSLDSCTCDFEKLAIDLREWNMTLEERTYCHINFNAPLPVWTRKDRKMMRMKMHNISYELRKKMIIEKLTKLNQSAQEINNTKLVEEMGDVLIQHIYLLRVTPREDIMFPLSMENVYDWKKVSKAINDRHTPGECQEFWHTKLHPSNRNRSWSKVENKQLAVMAVRYDLKHWDQIAVRLNTNRSASQCFMQYRRHIFKGTPQTEDQATENQG